MGQYTGAVLTVVGYVVGTYFGYPQLGAIVGAAVGYMVTPDLPTQRGPRLDDRRVQVSSFGVSIPLAFGSVRMAGNVIWAKDLEEVETETENGKGGLSQTVVSYTYFGTFAVLLCKNRIRGIRRIWADAVLIYNGTLDNPDAQALDFVWYPGTEDQLPDPTMEASLGVGNVPAYRGFAYVVFKRLALERFGNRIPSITVEVVCEGEWSSIATDLGPEVETQYRTAVQRMDGNVIAVSERDGGASTRLSLISPSTGEVLLVADHARPFAGSLAFFSPGTVCYIPPTDEVWVSQHNLAFGRYSAQTLAFLGYVGWDAAWSDGVAVYDSHTQLVVTHCANSTLFGDHIQAFNIYGGLLQTAPGILFARQLITGGRDVYIASAGSLGFAVLGVGQHDVLAVHGSGGLGCWDSLRQRYVIVGSEGAYGKVWTVNGSSSAISEYVPAGMFNGSPDDVQYLPALDVVIAWVMAGGATLMTVFDADTFEVLLFDSTVSSNGFVRAMAAPGDPGAVFAVGLTQAYEVQLYGSTVGAAVASLCKASGLESADFNVSELTQRLRGYLVSQVGPARSAIEQLAHAFFFEGTEQDDVLHFRRRGGATVATITATDCGAGVDNAAAFSITKGRAQEADLPAKLYITSPDPYTDHQPGTQYSERQASHAGEDDQLQLAVVMTQTESRRLADALLFDLWASRNRRTWSTTRKFARLVPSDPIVLDGERVRILNRSDDGSVIRWEGVTDDADVIVQLSSGVQGEFPRQAVVVNVPTTMLLLDIALLRDADDEPGAYVAAFGVPPNWRGSVLYTSPDDGVTWTRMLTVPKPGSAVGVATNALGAWSGGNVFDESNRLNVSLYNGAAESTTRLGVLNGGNALAISGPDGWEVLQYRDAVLEDDGTYTLTGLLRGRRGTEYAMAGHAQGDDVVLLSASTIRNLSIDSAVIGVERPYRAVSVGDTIANTSEHDEIITAERLRPWSPVQLGGGRDGGGNVLLQWRRRTRVGGEWRDSVDASLGEETEAYEVDIFTSSARTVVVRTITGLTDPSATYTAAEQTADFGAPRATVYWAAYQMSATVGRGHGANGTT